MIGDDTHNKKQHHNSFIAKGMIPIEKNIIVVDEQGNYYEATYPKRAKGLIKSGRARFIDENTICLACPPYDMEDDNMSNNTENIVTKSQQASELTMNYVLEQIEKIASETEYLHNAISELSKTQSAGPGDIGAQGKAHALGEIVTSREQTNQKLLSLYEKMYDDLKSQSLPSEKERLIAMLLGELGNHVLSASSKKAIEQALQYALQGPM